MATKRKSSEELFHLHKKVKETEGAPPPSPPATESFTALLKREAVEEFKGSTEFQNLVFAVSIQSFAEGFYACRHWINSHMERMNFSRYCFSTIPSQFRYLPLNYLEEVENALAVKAFEEEAARRAEEDEEEE